MVPDLIYINIYRSKGATRGGERVKKRGGGGPVHLTPASIVLAYVNLSLWHTSRYSIYFIGELRTSRGLAAIGE